ncbi:hypothetical protein [Neobacillus drentensis]|uniref:hypothetical protein n=1 Tax=Neobacillus drentensis TaxID=220684 RepID=UPI002FFE12C6
MNKKHFINSKHEFHYKEFKEFVDTYGINKVKKKDLDNIIKKHGLDVTGNRGFLELYTIKCSESSGRAMTWLTIIIGILTVAVSVVSIFN